ncbi:hypothetical protein GCM10007913_25610 [Devosia yakushimensis]|uniref:Methylated-DNA--protein-cysteine methyltransferase n=1 Tax=Devosia yakushimensis TaxID=470028 RepID=A0ABQ5UHI8_9HYPH|nr:methylated-DNA--[protein]-cysteine S-methyltransferase [Devosia yakushimensis]GLQ10629.1 hypothetical protein GCM10007913_25610 [Devosia yakushimensis]
MNEHLRAGHIHTPLGLMIAIVNAAGGMVRLDFEDDYRIDREEMNARTARDDDAVAEIAIQIGEYFAGERRVFSLPLAPPGSAFLHRAWAALVQVPFGTTVTYGTLAKRLDRPTSARAIGRANAINPLSIIVPCHRVIGANGDLTGYGGGIARKEALLRIEGSFVQGRTFSDGPK